jgi:hypothetical protein
MFCAKVAAGRQKVSNQSENPYSANSTRKYKVDDLQNYPAARTVAFWATKKLAGKEPKWEMPVCWPQQAVVIDRLESNDGSLAILYARSDWSAKSFRVQQAILLQSGHRPVSANLNPVSIC